MTEPGPSLPPHVGRRDTWEPVTARFLCDRCGEPACTLTLLPPFAPDPQEPPSGASGSLPDAGRAFADAVRLSIDGPVNTTHTFLPGMTAGLPVLDAAMRASDARAIHDLDREYAPFWCASCSKSYCRACWVVRVEYDESFYDCTRGRCPTGHERVMDD